MAATQLSIFNSIALPLIDSCFKGYNGTIMAYGQTGSGKTFTMGNAGFDSELDKGIIPRTIEEVGSAPYDLDLFKDPEPSR